MKQPNLSNTFITMHWQDLTHEEWQMVLESHMFLKEKQDGKIKDQIVAGWNKQRIYITKEDDSLPTVSTESALLTSIVYSKEIVTLRLSISQTRLFICVSKRKMIC